MGMENYCSIIIETKKAKSIKLLSGRKEWRRNKLQYYTPR
jgi:hypothetical protein